MEMCKNMICLHKNVSHLHIHNHGWMFIYSEVSCSRRACNVTICHMYTKMCHVFELYHKTMHDAKEDTECTLCIDKLLPIQNWVKSSNIQKVFAPARLHHVYFTRFFEPHLQCFNLKNDNNNNKNNNDKSSSSNQNATKHRTHGAQYTGNRCIIFPHFNSDCSDGWMQ